MPIAYIDKTRVWFGTPPGEDTVHCYHRASRLCDSAPADYAQPLVTSHQRSVCVKCLERLNTAVHDTRAAHYGGHAA